MADTKTSDESAASALGGTELIRGVQSAANVKITATQIKTFASASPTLVTPILGTPSSGTLASCTGLPAAGVVGTALVTSGALGTPGSGTLTNCTGLPPAGVVGTAAVLGANTFTGVETIPAVATTLVDKGSVGTGTVTFAATTQKQKLTVTGSLTIAYSSWPSSGTYGEVEVQLVNGAAGTITWPTVHWLKGDGTNSTTFSDMSVTLYSSGTNWVIVWSTDGGTTLYGRAA